MPSPNFSKDITTIFNSDIDDSLKFDVACRLLCETLELATVSMLIYNAKEDRLVCKGNYIAQENRSAFRTENSLLRNIINHIIIFEFFDSQALEIDHLTLENFRDSHICGKTFAEVQISEDQFTDLKNVWKLNETRDQYAKYKKILHNESYEIADTSISGTFFKKLLENRNKLTSQIEVKPMSEGPHKGKLYFDIWKSQGITIHEKDLYYIALPLFANERYTGILRLTVYADKPSKIEDLLSNSDISLTKSVSERLNNFAQLISLHLKTDYYLAGYRTLSNIKLKTNEQLQITKEQVNALCNILTNVINCNGCLVRITDNGSTGNPPLKGTSDTLVPYSEFIYSQAEAKFSDGIYSILSQNNKFGFKIKAINFAVNAINEDKFSTKEYYYDNNGLLKVEEQIQRHFNDFTPEYNQKLFEFKMREILIIPIDDLSEGIIILTNTANRLFTTSDIDMIFLAAKRVQLEIELKRKEINKLQEAQISGMNIVLHQFGQVIKSSFDVMEEIKERIDFTGKNKYSDKLRTNPGEILEKILPDLKLLGFLIIHSQSQIRRAERINKIDSEPITPDISTNYDFNTFLRNKCKDFEPYANVERDLHIYLTNDRDSQKFDTDIDLLTEVIYSLLDNAVKYSFEASQMKTKNIGFDEFNYRSDGNIKVSYTVENHREFEIRVCSWGPSISADDREIVFERQKRGKNSKDVVGTGIGLYLCKKIITALHGEIYVESEKNKTVFIIKLKM